MDGKSRAKNYEERLRIDLTTMVPQNEQSGKSSFHSKKQTAI